MDKFVQMFRRVASESRESTGEEVQKENK